METWLTEGRREEYLEELIRLEGRGDSAHENFCSSCPITTAQNLALYRCEDCIGTACLECLSCIIHHHKRLPFHRVKVYHLSIPVV